MTNLLLSWLWKWNLYSPLLASIWTITFTMNDSTLEDEQMLHLLRRARLMDIPSFIALQATAAAT